MAGFFASRAAAPTAPIDFTPADAPAMPPVSDLPEVRYVGMPWHELDAWPQGLLGADDPWGAAFGPEVMRHVLGLPDLPQRSYVTAQPFPVRPEAGWGGALTPQFAGLPFLWLPDRLKAPADSAQSESLEVWLVQVALESTFSGAWTPDRGWVDAVWGAAHVDVSSVAGQARVSAWLHGCPDEALDRVPGWVEQNLYPSAAGEFSAGLAQSLATVQQTVAGPMWLLREVSAGRCADVLLEWLVEGAPSPDLESAVAVMGSFLPQQSAAEIAMWIDAAGDGSGPMLPQCRDSAGVVLGRLSQRGEVAETVLDQVLASLSGGE
jgi:hypothetical protein